MPARRCELRTGRREVRHVAEPAGLSERHDAGMGDERLLAGDIDDDIGGWTKSVSHAFDIGRRERLFPAERDGGLGSGITDDEVGVDTDLLTIPNNRHAFNAAVFTVNRHRRRGQPDVAVALYRRGQRVPDTDRTLRTKAKTLERAFAGEIGQECAGWQLVGIAGKDSRAEVAEDRMNRGVAGVGFEPVFGRLPPVRKITGARVGEFFQNARRLLCQLTEQERPAAAAYIDELAIDEEGTGRFRGADVELRSDGIEGLLEHPAQLDRNGADVDRKAVDLLGRGTPADAVFVVHHNGVQPCMGQPRRGAKPASAGTNHHRIRPLDRHRASREMPPVGPSWRFYIGRPSLL
jgi:hypothetical protein